MYRGGKNRSDQYTISPYRASGFVRCPLRCCAATSVGFDSPASNEMKLLRCMSSPSRRFVAMQQYVGYRCGTRTSWKPFAWRVSAIPVHHRRQGRLPNVTRPSLLEPSFADYSLRSNSRLRCPRRRGLSWASALRQIAKALEKPIESLPARLTAMRSNLERLHDATVGANAKNAGQPEVLRESRAAGSARSMMSTARNAVDGRLGRLAR